VIDADRALRAFTDVLAVEYDRDADVARIVTVSDCYYAFPDDGMHRCPDREYHDPPEGHCKHVIALEAIRGNIDVPSGWFVTEDLDERTDPEFELDVPDRVGRNHTLGAFETDGGDCPHCTDELPCFDHFDAEANA
jgi:hypothetical protein